MEEHYIKDVGKITYVYSVNLEEHKTVIEKQQKRIAELEQELSELKTKYEDCENERLQNRIEYLTMKNKWLSTEQELAELKEKAIVPKFKIGQEVFIVNTDYHHKKDYKVEKHKIVGIEDKVDRKNTYVRWYSLEFKDCLTSYSKRYKFLEKNVFATETEAKKKLQELQNGDFSGE